MIYIVSEEMDLKFNFFFSLTTTTTKIKIRKKCCLISVWICEFFLIFEKSKTGINKMIVTNLLS